MLKLSQFEVVTSFTLTKSTMGVEYLASWLRGTFHCMGLDRDVGWAYRQGGHRGHCTSFFLPLIK